MLTTDWLSAGATDDDMRANQIRRGDWIQVFTGGRFYPLDPRSDEIRIADIAHSLSMQCRFTGHCNRFYSVAEHSVLVSRICNPTDALWGLLHDASEAYLCDLSRPIKRYSDLGTEYRKIEERLMRVVAEHFGLCWPEPGSVGFADKVILGIEARDLMAPLQPGWQKWLDLIGYCDIRLDTTLNPEQARQLFMARYEELCR